MNARTADSIIAKIHAVRSRLPDADYLPLNLSRAQANDLLRLLERVPARRASGASKLRAGTDVTGEGTEVPARPQLRTRTARKIASRPLRSQSPKRRKENAVRRPVLQALYDEDLMCRRCRAAEAEDGHEVLSRARGGSITDPANIALLCRRCHDWVTQHPIAAESENWSRSQFGGAA